MGRRTKAQQAQQLEAIEHLRKIFRPGSKVWTCVKHVSKSGMSRSIAVYANGKDGPYEVSFWVARALEYRIHPTRGGLVVGGCGMDMPFHLVNSLSYALHGYQDKGEALAYLLDAKENSNFGWRGKTRPGHYRAGYSLEKMDL